MGKAQYDSSSPSLGEYHLPPIPFFFLDTRLQTSLKKSTPQDLHADVYVLNDSGEKKKLKLCMLGRAMYKHAVTAFCG